MPRKVTIETKDTTGCRGIKQLKKSPLWVVPIRVFHGRGLYREIKKKKRGGQTDPAHQKEKQQKGDGNWQGARNLRKKQRNGGEIKNAGYGSARIMQVKRMRVKE